MADGQDGKPSRYRSQRKTAANSSPPRDNGINRSRSRYHRAGATHAQEQPPPITDQPTDLPIRSVSTRGRDSTRHVDAGAEEYSVGDDSLPQPGFVSSRHSNPEQSRSPLRIDPSQFRDAPTMVRAKAEAFLPEAEEGELSAEETNGCFGLFRKKKHVQRRVPSEKVSTPRSTASQSLEPPTIKPGGGGIVPGTDAPLSASNAGERHVLVHGTKLSITLPVGLTTTASDLITSAANCLSETIDVRASVLLEHFHSVGVQRPLRRYEHVKDVMNSWEDDGANSFMVVPSRAIEVNPGGLSATNAPRDKPPQCAFVMIYSQKPGSWDKRLITIRQDGQIVMNKINKPDETTNVCHLSDFDIYTPTAKQISKKIKPPKKICFAIKSQEKTSMFLSSQNYVHFFCTSERILANSFYDAVQGWRSWYLVNVMGEGKRTKSTALGRSSSKATKQSSHATQPSTGSLDARYQLGSYKPMMEHDHFDRPTSSHGKTNTHAGAQAPLNAAPARKPSTRERPHNSLPKTTQLAEDGPLVNLAVNRTVSQEREVSEAFTGDGLLGRSYSTRQKQVAEREIAAKNPWTAAQHLQEPMDGSLGRQTSVKRTSSTRKPNGAHDLRHRSSVRDRDRVAASDDLKRSGSTRAKEMPKPLIDLTPKYIPPPQHVKKGKGFHPDQVGPGGLIDNATSLEQAYYVPSSQDWRGQVITPAIAEERPRSRSRPIVNRAQNSSEQGFTGGLVDASHGGYTGEKAVGRGVMSGNRNAAQPMLDVSEESSYAPGSLLSKVARTEREEGRGGPLIDRSK